MSAVLYDDVKLGDISSRFTFKQTQLWHMCREKPFTLYGGARGGGKSFALRWVAVRLLLHWRTHLGLENVRVGIFCEDAPTLNDRQVSKALVEYPSWLGSWRMAPWPEFRLHPDFGHGVVCFRNLEDAEKYRSSEFAGVLVDELTRNPITAFNILRGSRRWPGIENPPFVAATNPTGIGHTWVRDIWVDQSFQLEETKNLLKVYGRDAFGYIKATARDNPHNAESYIKELESLPDRLRAAFLDGNWDVFEGQAFEEWHADYHVVKNWLPPTPQWRYAMGMDWGWRHGWMGLFASNSEGDTECVWEWYFSKVYAAEAAKEMQKRIRLFPRPEYIAADEQMWQNAGVEGGKTLAEEFQRGLLEAYGTFDLAPVLKPAVHGKGSRATKYDQMHQYLAWKPIYLKRDGKETDQLAPWARPRLRFHERCIHAIRTIKSLPVDPDKPEDDVDTSAEDHPYDGVGCYIMSRPPIGERREKPENFQDHPGLQRGGRRKPRYERLSLDTAQQEGDITHPYQVPRNLERSDD